MTRKIEPRFARKVLAVSISMIGLAGFVNARADDTDEETRRLLTPESEIEAGIGNVSKDSFKHGDFTGLNKSGAYSIANFSIFGRDKDDARYYEIIGRNLGLDSRSLKVEGGRQGDFGLRFEYSQLPKLFTDSYQTPFVNPGETRLLLPPGWVAANNTTGMTSLAGSMRSFDIETTRKAYSLGLTKLLPAGWNASVDFKHETKEGNKLIGAVIGSTGGNPRAAILPEPVDYTTDQFEAVARHITPKLQTEFGYYGSFFRNENSALAWQNPYANAAGTTWGNAAVGYAGGGFGQLSLPPDNQFHQVFASGGYNYSKDTRIVGKLSFGRMTQNESFLPYTVNPGLTVTTPLPRASLDGKVDTTHADLKLTSKLAPKTNFALGYRYDDRDNKTPQSQYLYIGGDSMNQPATLAVGQARTNLPGSSTKQQVTAELDHRLATQTKLKLGYEFDWIKKTFEAIDWEREHTVKAGVDHRFNEMVAGGISYAYSDRDTSAYDAGAPFLASYSPLYWGPMPVDQRWDNVPTQKKFFLAPRKRDKLHAHTHVSPGERVDLQFGVDYNKDDYHDSYFGLREAKGWAANFDASLQASDAVTGHVFVSYEHYGSDQRSSQLGAVKLNYLNPGYDWTADITDKTLTFGVGFRIKPDGKYEFGGDFSHSHSNGEINVASGPLITTPALPLPDVVSRLNRVDLFGRYWLQKDLSINLKYIYERYSSKDWAYDQVLPATMANVIGTNQVSPDYGVHVIGITASYRFF